MIGLIRRLWAGEVPLASTFWEYAVVYGALLNGAATIVSLGMLSADAPTALGLAIFFLPAPYNILAIVAVWRAAGRYQGAPVWSALARLAVVVLMAIATAV